MSVIQNKYIHKINQINTILKQLDSIDNYIRKKQSTDIIQLNECIRIFQLSNTYITKILENN